MRLIDNQSDLESLCEHLRVSGEIALDSEFARERTFYARLCLVQFAVGPDPTIALLDTLADLNLEPLWEALAGPHRKVLHAARQDLEVIHQAGRLMLKPLFDTQVAAGLLGYPPQSGYAALVEAELGVSLPKGHARADWRRRPLGPELLEYAADDVRYLLPLHQRLSQRLEQQGRLCWALEDSGALTDEALYQEDENLSWRRVKGIFALDGASFPAAVALARWRELTARRADRPRRWILDDAMLLELARRRPRDRSALEALKILPTALARRHGDTVIQIIDACRNDHEPPPENRPPTADERQRAGQLAGRVRRLARELAVEPQLLLTRAEIDALARGSAPARLLAGWRRQVVLPELGDASAQA